MTEEMNKGKSKAFQLMQERKKMLRSLRRIDRHQQPELYKQIKEKADQMLQMAQAEGSMSLEESHAVSMM